MTADEHGKASTYNNYSCRCDRCLAAYRRRRKERDVAQYSRKRESLMTPEQRTNVKVELHGRAVNTQAGYDRGYDKGVTDGYAEGRADTQTEIAAALQTIADACHVSEPRAVVAAYLRAARIARGGVA